MEAPMTEEQIESRKQQNRERRIQHLFGVVAPNGAVTEHIVMAPKRGDIQQRGDAIVMWANGEPQVTKRWKKKGFRSLEEVCLADGVPELFQRWKAAVGQRMRGLPLRGDPTLLYPPTVLELKRRARVGGEKASGMAFDLATGKVIEDPKIIEERTRERYASALEAAGVGNPIVQPVPPPIEAPAPAPAPEPEPEPPPAAVEASPPATTKRR